MGGSLELRPLERAGLPGSGRVLLWSGPCRFMKTFLLLRETWDFIFTFHLEIVLELLDWNVFRV